MKKLHVRHCAAALWILCLLTALTLTAFADDAPTITRDVLPAVTVAEGGSIRLSVEAAGADLEYQWYKNNDLIAGAVGAIYEETGFTAKDHGASYFCYVQNPSGGVSSAVCTVTVVTKPAITQDISATSVTLMEGDTLSLSAAASTGNSSGMLAQWYYVNGESATPITGQTGNSLSVKITADYNGREIFCQFTNEAGSASTSHCTVTVDGVETTATPSPSPTPDAKTKPDVTKDPVGETVEEGGMCLFIARANNTRTYTWRFVSPSGSMVYDYNQLGNMFPGLSVSGGSTETLTLSNIPYELDGWKVECLFTAAGGGTAVSGRAAVKVLQASSTLSIINQPMGGSMPIDSAEDFQLSIQASASTAGRLSYQWYSSATNSAASMRMISGATESTYPPPREEGTRYYRVSVVVNNNGVSSEPFYSAIVPVTFTSSKVHVHSYSSVWEHNDISHWHQCTCGDHADEDFHTFEWTILRKPTAEEDGEQRGVCTVCGYETVQPIPAGSMPETTPETAKPAARSSAGVWLILLGVLAVAVVAGASLLIWRVVRSKDEDAGEEETDEE